MSVLSCAVVGLTSCASMGGVGSAGDDTALTTSDFAASNVAATSAFEAVEHLRPLWLRPMVTRGTPGQPVGVVIDGRPGATFDDLRSLNVGAVERIDFLPYSEARQRYGTNFGSAFNGGAILVTLIED